VKVHVEGMRGRKKIISIILISVVIIGYRKKQKQDEGGFIRFLAVLSRITLTKYGARIYYANIAYPAK